MYFLFSPSPHYFPRTLAHRPDLEELWAMWSTTTSSMIQTHNLRLSSGEHHRKGAEGLILLFFSFNSNSFQRGSPSSPEQPRTIQSVFGSNFQSPFSRFLVFFVVSAFVFPSYIIFGRSPKFVAASFALPVSVCFQNEMLIVVSRPYKCLNFSARSPFPTSLLLSGTKMDFKILRISQPTNLCLAVAALSSVDRGGGRGASSLRARGGIRSILRDGAEIRLRPGLTVDRARTVVQWASS